jgi:hypothetical protein
MMDLSRFAWLLSTLTVAKIEFLHLVHPVNLFLTVIFVVHIIYRQELYHLWEKKYQVEAKITHCGTTS